MVVEEEEDDEECAREPEREHDISDRGVCVCVGGGNGGDEKLLEN